MALPASLWAGFTVRLVTVSGEAAVDAEFRRRRVMVDLSQAASALGGTVTLKDGEYTLSFASGTAVVNPHTGLYRVRRQGQKRWTAGGLDPAPVFIGPALFVPLDSLPILAFRPFTYHWNRKELTEKDALPPQAIPPGRKIVTARRVVSKQKEWFSLEDVARTLGIVVYSSRPGRYNLVMPDFTVLEVAAGELWVYRRKERHKPLEEPILLFSGVPHATAGTLSAIFDADLRWDPALRALLAPTRYGRLKEVTRPENQLLTVLGGPPKPFKMTVDEWTAFYQEPAPTYSEDHPELYESVRNFTNNRVLAPLTSPYGRLSGEGVVSLEGGAWSQPLEGGGRFEKLGTRGRVVNASLQWGFPRFQVKAGREYLQVAGLLGQVSLVDQGQVSHSNDSFGEGRVDPTWSLRALQGQHVFSVFVSTDLISQTVNFRQSITGGALEVGSRSGGHHLTGSLSFYRFKNGIREVSQDVNPFLLEEDIFLQEPVDPQLTRALAGEVLTDRHDTAVLDAGWNAAGWGKVQATGAMSRHHDLSSGDIILDDNWKLSGTLGERRSRLTVSHERVGPRYRSVGDPFFYQDRRVTRLSPYLDLARPWKLYGEFRREDFTAREHPDLFPYRSEFIYLTNALSFPAYQLRLQANRYEHTFSGLWWKGGADLTKYLGRDSLELGGAWATQWYAGTHDKSRQSYTGRLGYQVLRPSWKVSVGEELTRHHYSKRTLSPFLDRWESVSHLLCQLGVWEAAVHYRFEPRYYREREVLRTGYARIGREVGNRKVVSVFYSSTALDRLLGKPQVWRAGIEFVNDFF